MAQKKKSPAPKDLRSLKAVGVAGLQYAEFADELEEHRTTSQRNRHRTGVDRAFHSVLDPLPVGTIVRLVREDQSLFDPLAIRIDEEESGRKIGYVPRSQNATLARLMDAGYPLFGAVLQHDYTLPVSEFKRVTVAVYIEKARAR